ncbi:DNA-binding response regulator, NarL/FixJ family, contains REC and HTH domains [Amycolatopsis lurida]|uniref:LuxR family transcriptional regulator n=1 Tax=Amycolatopsis lurida NRRL 2430 TaxID=1460371 RepID=A0A2P2FWC6_AMYLU|nr:MULTISPECIES: response regulator transcription factor [Amycolatopsis]KFU81038.1 LuxR family transcriptional regulator [Amycolatopsis lurida NRRL 2430]QXV60532.1 DNA-binding response regulator [Amycolatopsis sp. TNS106]SED59476.1 DNA-binding response regulator, NarL/FixJ family, contains REC and HTH domains [Amycolatopsis lurida]
MTIRVVLADDQVLVRAGFRVLLETEDGFEVLAEAGDGEQAVAAAVEHRPDIVVMDVRMPGVDGLEATRRITANPELAGVKVLVLTTFDVDEYVYEALRAGASGFLLKDTDPVELLRALKVVAAGEALLAPTVTRRLIAEFVDRPENRRIDVSAVREITDREREVLGLVAGGMSNDEIAAHLVISTATARTHVSRIMTKIGARDRAQLVVLAYESGLVSPRRS